MAEHKITVEVTGGSGSGSAEELTLNSPTSGLGKLTSSLNVSKTSAAAVLGSFAAALPPLIIAKKTLDYGTKAATAVIGRLGTYTGNTFIDMGVSNVKTGFHLATSFLKDPILATIDTVGRVMDFKLGVYKQNLEAGYLAYELNYQKGAFKL